MIFQDVFDHMGTPPEIVEPREIPLIGFIGRSVSSAGIVILLVNTNGTTWDMEFLVINAPSSYNDK